MHVHWGVNLLSMGRFSKLEPVFRKERILRFDVEPRGVPIEEDLKARHKAHPFRATDAREDLLRGPSTFGSTGGRLLIEPLEKPLQLVRFLLNSRVPAEMLPRSPSLFPFLPECPEIQGISSL